MVAYLALFVALGGTSYAAVTLTKGSVKKKHLAKNAVVSKKVKDGSLKAKDFKPGELVAGAPGPAGPAGPQGPQGERGPEGPVDTSALQTRVARSGETLTGMVAVRFPSGTGFDIVGDKWGAILPTSAPAPILDIVGLGSSTTTECPGAGEATAGRLCVYVYNSNNFDASHEVPVGGSTSTAQRRYGWAMEVEIASDSSGGYMAATWAYKVP